MAIFNLIAGVLASCFGLIALSFAVLKGKGARFVSGFTSLPRAERVHYDHVAIAQAVRNQYARWASLCALGCVLGLTLHPSFALIACLIWLFDFGRNVHFDAKKAFARYRR